MSPSQRRASSATAATARDRLLAATADLLATVGPQGATSRAIARAAGENLASITYYFGSKDQLVAESLVTSARVLLAPVLAELSRADVDPTHKLLAAAQLLYRILDDNRHQLPGYLHSLAAAPGDDLVRAELHALHRGLSDVLAREMEARQADGQLPAWIEPEPMAQLIVAVANGVAVASAVDPERTDATAIGAQFAQLLLASRP